MEEKLQQPQTPQSEDSEDTGNKIIIEEIDPEEIDKIWDSLPEINASF